MDDETNARIHELARSLKSLHLAATMEEALARAKEVILSSQEGNKPLAAMMDALNQKTEDSMKIPKEQLNAVKEDLKQDKQEHSQEKEELTDTEAELDELECAVDDAEKLVKKAKKVQKKE